MKNLYNCYGEEDKIILIGKQENIENKIINEVDFEYTDEIENSYLIFDYNEEHKILNNGFRHIFDVKINDELEEINVFYNENGEIEDFGIRDENGYRDVYIRYDAEKFRDDLKRVVFGIIDYYLNIAKDDCGYEKLSYLYTGENIELYLESENEKIALSYELHNLFETLILSVAKDELVDDYETFTYVVNGVFKDIKDKYKNIILNEIEEE